MSNQLDRELYDCIDTTKNALRTTGGGGSSGVQLPSADDATITLDGDSEAQIVITGDKVNVTVDLGVATAYDNGKTVKIMNASTEFVIVQNSDSTVFEFLPPSCVATLVLTDNSSAAGVWSFTRTMVQTDYGFSMPNTNFNFGSNDFTIITLH